MDVVLLFDLLDGAPGTQGIIDNLFFGFDEGAAFGDVGHFAAVLLADLFFYFAGYFLLYGGAFDKLIDDPGDNISHSLRAHRAGLAALDSARLYRAYKTGLKKTGLKK
jgi:hypothetical protein